MNPLVLFALVVSVWASPIQRALEELAATNGSVAEDFLVTSLPGLEDVPEHKAPLMHAGQLELYKENNTHFFFWRFSDRHKAPAAQNKTIFWLNGGPGCSSMDGALMEAGPFRVNKHQRVEYNEGSWHRMGDVVFVDQPAGTGFSYGTDFDSELADVSWHFLRFLEQYFAVFPADAAHDIVLAGESYAGQYIPYIAQALHERNAHPLREGAAPVRLAGLLIGNGYISPNEQGLSYVPFAVQAKLIDQFHPQWREVLRSHERCQHAVDRARADDSLHAYKEVNSVCDAVLSTLLQVTQENGQCVNMYDYTLRDSYPSCGMNWPPDLAHVRPFLRDDAVMDDLNLVRHKKWHECSGSVGSHMRARSSMPAVKLLPALLEHYPVVLFHGNRDIICNYMGAEDMVAHLKWNGARGFSDATPRHDWVHGGAVEGYLRTERNLTFVNVFDSSHMVPFDKPEASRALVDLLYGRYEVADGAVVTVPLEPETETEAVPERPSADAAAPAAEPATSAGAGAESGSEADADAAWEKSGRAVRVIQLLVVLVLIWGVCALYSTYRSQPTSIIKTRPTGRKKNVQWADQLEEGPEGSTSLFSKVMGKWKSPPAYQPVDDIEMDGLAEEDTGNK